MLKSISYKEAMEYWRKYHPYKNGGGSMPNMSEQPNGILCIFPNGNQLEKTSHGRTQYWIHTKDKRKAEGPDLLTPFQK